MALFPRLLTVLPLCFFMVGWELFVIGFGWLLSTSSDNMPISYWSPYSVTSTDPSLYPFYVTLVGGPFIALAGLLHALVTIPILSSILCCHSVCFMIGWGLFAANFSWLLDTSNNLVMPWGVTLSYIVHHQEPTLPSITCTSF